MPRQWEGAGTATRLAPAMPGVALKRPLHPPDLGSVSGKYAAEGRSTSAGPRGTSTAVGFGRDFSGNVAGADPVTTSKSFILGLPHFGSRPARRSFDVSDGQWEKRESRLGSGRLRCLRRDART